MKIRLRCFDPRQQLAWLLFGGVVTCLLAAGCTRGGSPTKEGLEKRCKEYWTLRLDGNWKSIYDYLAPEERKFVSRERFINDRSQQLRFSEYTIESLEIKGSQGVGKIKCKWRVQVPGDLQPYREGESVLSESWLFVNGDWYLQMLNPSMEPPK